LALTFNMRKNTMQETRCCGTGTCLIDAHGRCWCGQQWDGEKMCHPSETPTPAENQALIDVASKADGEEGPRS
jgi:hypothetical protein